MPERHICSKPGNDHTQAGRWDGQNEITAHRPEVYDGEESALDKQDLIDGGCRLWREGSDRLWREDRTKPYQASSTRECEHSASLDPQPPPLTAAPSQPHVPPPSLQHLPHPPPPTPRQILKSAHSHHPFLLTRLAHTYLSASLLPAAQTILNSFPNPPPLFLWSETIKAYSRNGRFRSALDVYHRILSLGVCPNEFTFTFTFVLPACAGARDPDEGRRIHEDVLSFGCGSNIFVATALVDMYGKCGDVGLARRVFDGMPVRGAPSFHALISGRASLLSYVSNGEYEEAISIFNQMQQSGVQFDAMTMAGVLQACSHLGTLQRGKWIHEQVLQTNMDISIHFGAALITMYARCGSINDGRRMFDGMPERDLICWTAIISGYGMHGLPKDAEVLFNEMVASGVKPDATEERFGLNILPNE
ncbi:pentatricopeptide repeat-containing protein At2g33760-like [Zingiber officinale]|uniref:pentatricopeptide repeat-containing protein At2g33760-like n=1 Tax=Zingiber officinale TaxID=94328 RepID=UPI001C4B8B61|nr:pentatricopeptide repeat-containing protein At2g33760-like [Zingiber officinale]